MLQVPIHAVFKNWSSSDARGLMHIEGLRNNLDGEAVLWAARRLTRRPERRHVMFVLSDGDPAGHSRWAGGGQYLKQAVKRAERAGIEVYGIGMESAAVENYYQKSWPCNSMSDLTSLALSVLTEVLISSRSERRKIAV